MSTILYNTNSKLIQKYQRTQSLIKKQEKVPQNNTGFDSHKVNILNPLDDKKENNNYDSSNCPVTISNNNIPNKSILYTNGRGENESGSAFQSFYEKNTPNYLKELCCSIYPESLHNKINELSSTNDNCSLEVHTFFALIIKNFINTWYGIKIPTSDDELHKIIFNMIDDLIHYVQMNNKHMNIEALLLDDIPILISYHILSLRKLKYSTLGMNLNDDEKYKRYCQLSMIEVDRYPFIITNKIKRSIANDSILQDSFADSLLNKLLFDRVLSSCTEPYYALRGIIKICDKILKRKENSKDESSISDNSITPTHTTEISTNNNINNIPTIKKNKYSYPILKVVFEVPFYSIRSTIVSALKSIMNFKISKREKDIFKICTDNSISDRYIFSLLFTDILRLPQRKPLLYSIGRYIQYVMKTNSFLNEFTNKKVNNMLTRATDNTNCFKYLLNSIRNLLFPTDNNMGPRTEIPTGEEFRKLKLKCAESMLQVLQKYKLQSLLGINDADVHAFIDTICQEDRRYNKLLAFQVIDCIITNLQGRQ